MSEGDKCYKSTQQCEQCEVLVFQALQSRPFVMKILFLLILVETLNVSILWLCVPPSCPARATSKGADLFILFTDLVLTILQYNSEFEKRQTGLGAVTYKGDRGL